MRMRPARKYEQLNLRLPLYSSYMYSLVYSNSSIAQSLYILLLNCAAMTLTADMDIKNIIGLALYNCR